MECQQLELTNKLVASQTKGKKDMVNKIEYTEEGNGKIVLTVAIKNFDYYEKHTDLFASMNKWLHQYDAEVLSFRDRLFEYDIGFPPSYPFCEDVADGISYMKTRVPSWCDRVLLTHASKDILSQDPCHLPVYDLIGKDICMGDHKPVYLYVVMKPGKGNHLVENESSVFVEPDLQQLQIEEVDKTVLSSQNSLSLTPDAVPDFHRPRTLSINGEKVVGFLGSKGSEAEKAQDVDWSLVNIHDYAKFEQEKYLMPDFRNSIKKLEVEGERSSVTVGNISGKPPIMTRKRSFKEMACKVKTMEKVLKMWPRRPKSRHHSSSSEDFSQSESDSGSRGKASGKVFLDLEADRASETTSVDTASVDLSPSKSVLNEGTPVKGALSESNNNDETCVLQEPGKNNSSSNIGKSTGSVKNSKTNEIDLIVTSGEVEEMKENNLVVMGYGLKAEKGETLDCSTPSQAAAVTPGSVDVGCTGVLDVVPPMHEEQGPVVARDLSQGGNQQSEEKRERDKKTQEDTGSHQSPAQKDSDKSTALPATTAPASSRSCCGYCRCVVL
ncbi:type I inositol-1,4,5-trisphosphate 5-phosphatase [Elysia marginata]|uniref:inositol-polyphosphate 5-phosphatase n=1 Tax=Elysia marginata TaxID=1093978 RepID=A0AAV4JX29_9GAST|nr:type I inositol-1,4,5-trisphosphate 5-phosphatase [Elysia marginata]